MVIAPLTVTRDYLIEGKIMKADIATDLAPFSVDYAAKMQHARHLFGLLSLQIDWGVRPSAARTRG